MIPTFDLMKVLTAVTPIVTSIVNNNKNTERVETQKYSEPNINITINNHFYSTPTVEELQAVQEVNKRLINEISSNNNHYLI